MLMKRSNFLPSSILLKVNEHSLGLTRCDLRPAGSCGWSYTKWVSSMVLSPISSFFNELDSIWSVSELITACSGWWTHSSNGIACVLLLAISEYLERSPRNTLYDQIKAKRLLVCKSKSGKDFDKQFGFLKFKGSLLNFMFHTLSEGNICCILSALYIMTITCMQLC